MPDFPDCVYMYNQTAAKFPADPSQSFKQKDVHHSVHNKYEGTERKESAKIEKQIQNIVQLDIRCALSGHVFDIILWTLVELHIFLGAKL